MAPSVENELEEIIHKQYSALALVHLKIWSEFGKYTEKNGHSTAATSRRCKSFDLFIAFVGTFNLHKTRFAKISPKLPINTCINTLNIIHTNNKH